MTRDGHDGDRAALHEAMSASGRSVKTAAAEKRRIDMLRRHEREVSAGNVLRLTKWGSSSKMAPPEKGAGADAMLKVIAPYDEPSGSTSEVALFAWLNSHVGVIHPLGAFRIRWDVVTSVVLFACLLVTPYQLCFIRADLRPMDRMELLNLAFDVVFLADFFLNFNTGYVDDHGTVVKDHRRIFKQYARGWAAVDLVSSIPVNHLLALANSGLHLGATSRLTKLMRLFKFSRMLKVFKVLKLASSLNEWDDDPAVKVIKDLRRFTSLLLGVFFTAHYAACAFAYAAQGTTRGWSKSTWVADYFNGGEAVRHGEDEPAVDDHHDDHGHRHVYRAFPAPMELYCVAMYWAFSTLTTVGYGDVLPVSRAEMAVTVVVQFAGTCILGYVMGDVASMLTKEEASSRMIKDRIESINAYMKHRGLPPELKAQIRSHFSYSWQKTSVWDEREILLELPAFMRNEVVLYCNASVLDCVPSLRGMPRNAAAKLCLKFEHSFTVPGQCVVEAGDAGNHFYVVASGALEASVAIPAAAAAALDVEPELLVRSFARAEFFAEYVLFAPRAAVHPFSVRAMDASELLLMPQATFADVAGEEPVVAARFRVLAERQYAATLDRLRKRSNLTGVKRPRCAEAREATCFPWQRRTRVVPELDGDGAPSAGDVAAALAAVDAVLAELRPRVPGNEALAAFRLKVWARRWLRRREGLLAGEPPAGPTSRDQPAAAPRSPADPLPPVVAARVGGGFSPASASAPGAGDADDADAAARARAAADGARKLLEEAKGDIVRDILAALDRRARDDRVDLERIVAERTLDAVTTHGAMERTKAMMRGSKA